MWPYSPFIPSFLLLNLLYHFTLFLAGIKCWLSSKSSRSLLSPQWSRTLASMTTYVLMILKLTAANWTSFWDRNVIYRLIRYLPWDVSTCMDWPIWLPVLHFHSPDLGKKHHYPSNAQRRTAEVVLDTLFSLPSYTHTSSPITIIFHYFSALPTSLHFHHQPPLFQPLSSLSNSCPFKTVLAKVMWGLYSTGPNARFWCSPWAGPQQHRTLLSISF